MLRFYATRFWKIFDKLVAIVYRRGALARIIFGLRAR